jgi:hypothetical protein
MLVFKERFVLKAIVWFVTFPYECCVLCAFMRAWQGSKLNEQNNDKRFKVDMSVTDLEFGVEG